MATRDDVLDAIHRIETAGGAGDRTREAQAALTLPLPEAGYDRVLSQLRSAHPRILSPTGVEQLGRAAQAMKDAEAALGHQLSATAAFDRQVLEALRHVHQTTVQGRRRLDSLETEIVGAAQAWDLSTAAGAREFQRFLIAKLGEIIRVVEEANDDDTSKQALATALMTLYNARNGRDDPEPADRQELVDGSTTPPAVPAAMADVDDDPYLDPPPADGLEPGYPASPQLSPEMPAMPTVPGFGGESPAFGAMPSAVPSGLPLTGLGTEPRDTDALDDEEYPADAATIEKASHDDPDGGEPADDAAPEPSHDNGPAAVRLPDGATITVADPRLAAAMQAAADGTPVAEAFRRQGIDIAPPGTPVSAPVDEARLRPGDIGVFTDRLALAVGDGKALLDGQIHLTGNLRGPGFLGWQHPPLLSDEPGPIAEPVPTRTAGIRRA
ncbi:DUF4226 domain-containing protein [[Mycobacterium] nativiensis]|uniref:DUF4226 domain-containing protein n=1 Tax=[Mycobacterium] nativiensis TaxID=2855503 RepID=A0ABU5Y0X0_9MYCO|nr:DUF4226 domain-containing protein [Mycolicibacter sp. MYC340]MEB3033900.1 DUF4226 domain-containing protein [Mycolicibacter sp. MYC340]